MLALFRLVKKVQGAMAMANVFFAGASMGFVAGAASHNFLEWLLEEDDTALEMKRAERLAKKLNKSVSIPDTDLGSVSGSSSNSNSKVDSH